jgi:molybdopterin converting factor small subunit
MKVTVKLIGPMIYAAGFSEKVLELPEGATTDDLLAQIKIEKDRPKIVTRNGKAVSQADALSDGDRVVISPIYSGG